jgi:ABC-type Na+ efflux pump permease subunit
MLGLKGFYLPAFMFSAVLLSLLSLYILPSSLSKRSSIFCYIQGDEPQTEFFKKQIESERSVILTESRKEVIDSVKKRPLSYGIIISSYKNNTSVEAILRGYESIKTKNNIRMLYSYITSDPVELEEIESRKILNNAKRKLPFNERVIPLSILFVSCIMTFFLIINMLMSEKENNTFKSIIISPSSIIDVVMSKVLFMTILGAFSGLIIIYLNFNLNQHYWLSALTILSCSFFSSSLGAFLSSFFKNLYRAATWIFILLAFLTLPVTTYFTDRFDSWIKVLPTSLVIDALLESLFYQDDNWIIFQSIGYTMIIGLVLFSLSILNIKKGMYK